MLLAAALPVRAVAVDVTVEGIEGAPLENVRAMLSIAAELPEDVGGGAAVRRLHRRAPDEIRRALRPYGYYDPAIETRLEHTDDGWRAVYRIDPGARVRLAEVRIEIRGDAADDPAFEQLRSELALRAGEPLLHPEYTTAKQRLLELAADRGYFDARWQTHSLRIDPDALEAHAVLVLASGPRHAFGEVTFEQAELAESFLRRYLPFAPGEPYRGEQLRELRYTLDDSDYFRRVDVQAQRDRREAGQVPIRVALEPRTQNRYTFGVGFGTDTGARVSAGWQNRYVNRQGHSLDTQIELAEISTRVSARYRVPLEEPAREQLVLEAVLASEEIGGGETGELTLATRRVAQLGRFRNTLSLEYQRSEDAIGDATTTRELVIPGAGLTYSRFDDEVYATRGFRVSGQINGASETLGSDTRFLRGRIDAEAVRRLWPGGRVLLRGELGTVKLADVDDLPLSQRFFAGGDNSVRGFDYQALGPTDARGKVVGGRHLAVGSVELEQLIRGDWGAAVFVDTGNAMNDWDVALRTAAGVGLRYRSPVGVFRVDVAKALDGDESPRLHLSLGVNL